MNIVDPLENFLSWSFNQIPDEEEQEFSLSTVNEEAQESPLSLIVDDVDSLFQTQPFASLDHSLSIVVDDVDTLFQTQPFVSLDHPLTDETSITFSPNDLPPITEELPSAISTSNDTPKTRKPRKRWTPEEAQKLLALVEIHGVGKWTAIASNFENPTRNAKDCRQYWDNYLAPKISNENWSIAETIELQKLYQELGPKWTKIGKRLPTPDNKIRPTFQCKNKWMQMNKSNPPLRVIDKWSKDQDVTLAGLVARFSNQWILIAKHQTVIKGIYRNDVMCRRHWTYLNQTGNVPLPSSQPTTAT